MQQVTTPTRQFFLEVPDELIPVSKDPKKGFTSFKTSDGLFFNTRARLPASKVLQYEMAEMTSLKIKELIAAEARKLQEDWKRGVPRYFNRRAYGMYFRKKGYFRRTSPLKFRGRKLNRRGTSHDMNSGPFTGPAYYLYKTRGRAIEAKYTTGRQQFPGRTSTGQLRRALLVTDVTIGGCTLIVRPCYAATGNKIDYVNILMNGARRHSAPYVPAIDRRIKTQAGTWKGIRQSYWLNWQKVFIEKVNIANKRLRTRIEELLIRLKVIERSDLRVIFSGARKTKKLTALETEAKSRRSTKGLPIVPGSTYNKTRDGKYWAEGSYKRDPQVYTNRFGTPFNPYEQPLKGLKLKKKF